MTAPARTAAATAARRRQRTVRLSYDVIDVLDRFDDTQLAALASALVAECAHRGVRVPDTR